jgi:hypothetical protein
MYITPQVDVYGVVRPKKKCIKITFEKGGESKILSEIE